MLTRLLIGETLPLDLVNTEWVDHGANVDFLDDPAAAAIWFRDYGFDPDEEDIEALLAARTAIRACLDAPGPDADAAINVVLAHGAERTTMTGGTPSTASATDDGWRAAWQAARAFAELMGTHPDRIRQCAHPDCVLYFYDVSKNGSRRWHSMETCGARTKSARHYRKHVDESKSKTDSTNRSAQ